MLLRRNTYALFIITQTQLNKNISYGTFYVKTLEDAVHGFSAAISPITAQCCFSITPENVRKPLGFLMFSGGIEKQHRAVMG